VTATVSETVRIRPDREPRVIVATIRVFHRLDYVYLSPYIVVDGDVNVPFIWKGHYKAINGWKRYRQLRKQHPEITHPNFEIIDRLSEMKQKLTSKEMLTHPETADLLLELNDRNRQSSRQTLLEFLIRGEWFRQAKLIKMMTDSRC